MILASPVQQTPSNQPPNSLVLPAETPSGAAPSRATPSGSAPQPIQQQQVSWPFKQKLENKKGHAASKLGKT